MAWLNRLGIFPVLLIGLLFIIVGGSLVMSLMNNSWLVPPDNVAFLDLQRRSAEGLIDGPLLYQNSDRSLITAFLIGILIMGMGATMPLAYLVNRRIRSVGGWAPVSYGVLIRQGLWAGTWLAICIWLQMSRTLSIPIALLILAIFLLVEAFIMIRQRSAETAQTGRI
ncbi:MAG: hypothetical protein ACPG8W_05760 [Candidatus Promineifilaceae bacterium]